MDEQHKTGHIDVWWLYDDGGIKMCFFFLFPQKYFYILKIF